MNILYNIPGLIYVGTIENPKVNHGNPVPLFKPITPKDRPSINTLEGWNALAETQNLLYFRRRYGREPHNDNELQCYSDALTYHKNECLPLHAIGIPGVE